MKQPASSNDHPPPHENDWRRKQYEALARCDISIDDVQDLLVDMDDDGATRIVVNSKVILDEIANRTEYLDGFPEMQQKAEVPSEELMRVLHETHAAKTVSWFKLVRRHAIEQQLAAARQAPEPRSIRSLADWLQTSVSKKDYERIYSQIILDIQEEHDEALANQDELKARFVIVRGYLSVALARLAQLRFVGAVIRALRG